MILSMTHQDIPKLDGLDKVEVKVLDGKNTEKISEPTVKFGKLTIRREWYFILGVSFEIIGLTLLRKDEKIENIGYDSLRKVVNLRTC